MLLNKDLDGEWVRREDSDLEGSLATMLNHIQGAKPTKLPS